MNWGKVILGGVLAGIVVTLAGYVLHEVILGATYEKYPDVFTQQGGSPAWFFVIGILISLFAAILFAKTRRCWADGLMGGVTFGFWLGMVAFFSTFYNPLVIDGFPYFLSWCWGGCNLIEAVLGGAVLGLVFKTA